MREVWLRWVALLERRESPESLAAMRILAGATAWWTLAHAWWSGAASALWVAGEDGGIGTVEPGLLALLGGASWGHVCALLGVGIAAATMLVFGWRTRLASCVTWLCFRTLVFANPQSGGAGDDVVSNVLFLLLLSGAGRAWSIDARRRGASGATAPAWPRYVAIGQLVTIYISAGWHKMSASWMPHGSLDAVWYSLQNPIWQRRPVPTNALLGRLAQGATLTTWLFEVSSPLLLLAFYYRATFDRPGRLRRWFIRYDVRSLFLAVGFCLHLGIELTLEVGSFFGGIMALYAACLHPDEWRALLGRLSGLALSRNPGRRRT